MSRTSLFLIGMMCMLSAPAMAQNGSTTRTTVDGRPLASSLPAKARPARTQASTLQFAELPQHLGESVEITTIHGVRRLGRVDAVTGSTLRLRVSAGLGYAIVNIERAQVRLIRDLD